jgi:hypothetical protein
MDNSQEDFEKIRSETSDKLKSINDRLNGTDEKTKETRKKINKYLEDIKMMESKEAQENREEAVEKLLEEERQNMENKKSGFKKFVDEHEDLCAFAILGVTVLGFIGICAGAAYSENKIKKEYADKVLDAELEAFKYQTDKEAERDTKVSDNIAKIVHDITNPGESEGEEEV